MRIERKLNEPGIDLPEIGDPRAESDSRLAHVTLATADVVRTRDFFARTLGWLPIKRPGNIAVKSAWLAIAPGQELHLLHVHDFEPSPFEREFGRHIAIEYPLEGFEALKRRLTEQGAELIAPERETPFERFFFRDPNGYVFEVVEAKHVSET
jgi:catechol 2,3-dioxygenase-like lactoylglutathione lyase family enzyme